MTVGFHPINPEHWHERAEDIRVAAFSLNNAEAKARMLKIAGGYEDLGRQAEEQLRNRSPVHK